MLPGAPGLAVFETRDLVPINHPPVPFITARTNFLFLFWCHAHHNPVEECSGGSAGATGLEHLPRIRVPGIGQRERMELAEAEVCPATSFPTLMLRPGLETRETRGTRPPPRNHYLLRQSGLC